MNRKHLFYGSAILMILVFVAGWFVYNKLEADKLGELAKQSNSLFKRPHSPTYGSMGARVRIVEFFDPSCETCRAFHPAVKGLVDANPGKVQLVIRYAPFHEGSDTAVRILEAARLQGLFWPVAEAMLKAQPIWAAHDKPRPELIWDYLGGTGLNVAEARNELSATQIVSNMKQDLDDARALNVTRTPGFFVNGRPLKDFGFQQLKALVDEEVRLAYQP
ncbi:MAG: DsbA family protein [Ramlibacter sp.]